MYKDKDKQREANRKAQAKFKAKQGITNRPPSGITGQGITEDGYVPNVIPKPKDIVDVLHNRILANPKVRLVSSKRGKDIKSFADLPPDVQQTIDRMSESNEEKQKRTAIAIHYQHAFPNGYHPKNTDFSGVVTGKPGDADYNGICTPEWRAKRGR